MMTKDEIRLMLRSIPDVRAADFNQPTEADWVSLEATFNTRFPPEFKAFIELMAEFSFPGDIYNVTSAGQTNGNDSIMTVYANEKS
ncbi:SMI1/KNR4 family protein, partial [Termitidicoccus mucosus]